MTEWIEDSFYCGQIKLMSIEIDMYTPKDDRSRYVILYNLPGYKSKSVKRFQTIETAKDTANRMFRNWLMLVELSVF